MKNVTLDSEATSYMGSRSPVDIGTTTKDKAMTFGKIEAPQDAEYLSQFMDELPKGILNKRATGVGGTHLAITSPDPYIISVPTVELIKNKMSQHDHVFGVYGDTHYREFRTYIRGNEQHTIITTYDSLPKVVRWLGDLGVNAYTDFKLLVDEYHQLLTEYSYRDKAINGVLDESLKFDHYTFLSATPIKPNFTPKQLQGIPYCEIEWSSTRCIKPIRAKINQPYKCAVNVIKKFKAHGCQLQVPVDGHKVTSHELYFFVNSVKAIKAIIDKAGLDPSEVKIICSDSERNRVVLGEGFRISQASDPNKPITFVTSKAFLGVDFYSDTGMIFIISNPINPNTLLDMQTAIFQIAGRIRNRNNPFRHLICHLYMTSNSTLSREEFEQHVKEKTERTHIQVETFNRLDDITKAANRTRYAQSLQDDYSFYNPETDELEFDELKRLNEEFNYEVIHQIYRDGFAVRQAYLDAGFDVSIDQRYLKLDGVWLDELTSLSLRNALKEYCDLVNSDDQSSETIDRKCYLETLYSDIKHWVSKLGTSRIKTLGYSQKKINQVLHDSSYEVSRAIKSHLKQQLVVDEFYSRNEVKSMLEARYKECKVTKKAKATDLEEFLTVKAVSRKINGKTVRGYVILSHDTPSKQD